MTVEIRRHLKVYSIFFRNVLIETMAYRFNFFLMVCINSGWFFIQLLTYGLIFTRVKALAGWAPFEVVFLASTWQIIFSAFIALFVTNLTNISWFVRTGEMDFVLSKPVSPLFYMSFNRVEMGSLLSLGIGVLTLVVAATKLPGLRTDPFHLLAYGVLVMAGIVLMYALMLMIMSFSFWTTRASSVQGLFWALQEFGGYPAEIYGSTLRWVLTFIVPVAVIANVPARVVLKNFDVAKVTAMLGVSVFFFFLARFIFYQGLKRYRSASS
jgi:ABC-2 type transport system permease protein